MLITTARHERIVAAKDAEIAGLRELVAKHARAAADQAARHKATEVDACNLASECNRLRARLAVFTAPRQRDSRGRYQPTPKVIDQMIAALEAM